MDRWGPSEDNELDPAPKAPAGNVAKMGMGSFVKANQGIGTTAAVTVGKAEVVPSRKAQKAQAAAVAMPPPPPPSMSSARPNQAAPPPGQAAPQPYPVPGWACMPAAAAQLDVLKDGATIQCIPLHKPSTVFGRSPSANVQLDHPSLSRMHGMLGWHRQLGWVIADLGSVHGTYHNGNKLPAKSPTAVKSGDLIRFGASTREYVFSGPNPDELPPARSGEKRDRAAAEDPAAPSGNAKNAKRRGVRFADGANDDDAPGTGLEQIIGYSDSKPFGVNVGPVAISEGTEGKFAGLVSSRVVPAGPEGKKGEEGKGEEGKGQNSQAAFRSYMEEQKKKLEAGRNLYDILPPPKK